MITDFPENLESSIPPSVSSAFPTELGVKYKLKRAKRFFGAILRDNHVRDGTVLNLQGRPRFMSSRKKESLLNPRPMIPSNGSVLNALKPISFCIIGGNTSYAVWLYE
jgi:hypothetical protein